MKIRQKLDMKLIGYLATFEKITRASAVDFFENKDQLIFMVDEAFVMRAVGKGGINIKKLAPYAIAFEDPKLVGSGKSITQYRSSDVKKFAELFKNSKIIPLCGAGINSADDAKEAYALGCKGVLIASAIANVNKPEKLLKEIAEIERWKKA